MSLSLTAELPPLRTDEHGAVRVGRTRVLLEHVVRAFRARTTPEQIVEAFDTLDLADVYSVLGYYLRHRDQVDGYVARREAEAAELRARVTRDLPPFPSRDELLARKAAGEGA